MAKLGKVRSISSRRTQTKLPMRMSMWMSSIDCERDCETERESVWCNERDVLLQTEHMFVIAGVSQRPHASWPKWITKGSSFLALLRQGPKKGLGYSMDCPPDWGVSTMKSAFVRWLQAGKCTGQQLRDLFATVQNCTLFAMILEERLWHNGSWHSRMSRRNVGLLSKVEGSTNGQVWQRVLRYVI